MGMNWVGFKLGVHTRKKRKIGVIRVRIRHLFQHLVMKSDNFVQSQSSCDNLTYGRLSKKQLNGFTSCDIIFKSPFVYHQFVIKMSGSKVQTKCYELAIASLYDCSEPTCMHLCVVFVYNIWIKYSRILYNPPHAKQSSRPWTTNIP